MTAGGVSEEAVGGVFTVAPSAFTVADGAGQSVPLLGSVEFRLRQPAVPAAGGVEYTGPVTVDLDSEGRIPEGVVLPAWPGATCEVVPRVRRGPRARDLRVVPFEVPAEPGSLVVLSDFISFRTDSSGGTVYVRGPRAALSVEDAELLDHVRTESVLAANESRAAAEAAGDAAEAAAQSTAGLGALRDEATAARDAAAESAENVRVWADGAAESAGTAAGHASAADQSAIASAQSAGEAAEAAAEAARAVQESETDVDAPAIGGAVRFVRRGPIVSASLRPNTGLTGAEPTEDPLVAFPAGYGPVAHAAGDVLTDSGVRVGSLTADPDSGLRLEGVDEAAAATPLRASVLYLAGDAPAG